MPEPAAPDLVLASVRQPGGKDCLDIHIARGVVSRITAADKHRSGARTVDLAGRYAIPGLWDEHVHMTQWAMAANRIDLSHAASAGDAVDVVRSRLADGRLSVAVHGENDGGSDPTLVGVGFRDALWADVPSLAMLDAATQGRPAALISHDLHCVWLNSAAAKRYGVHVDASGLLREEPAFALTRELGRLPDAVVDAWVDEAARKAAARGVVGIVDFEMTWNREVWLRRVSGGFRSLRVEAGVYPEHLDRARREAMRTGQDIPGGNGLLRVGPLKVLIDGSLNTRTAYCVDPYPHGGRGLLTVSEPELLALLVRAREAGFVPAVHAIGDAANQVALDAFEAAGIRGRIEHAQFVRQEDFARFGRLGLTASVQPAHALDDRDAADANWGDRTDRAFPLRSLLAAGATLALGSDAPVAPLDPWTAMSAATTRSGPDGRGPWHPEQAITREEALAASARGRRRIRAGDPADIAVLNDDPLGVPHEVFASMPVAATLVAGRFTYDGGGTVASEA
ncbi:putative amidohydrolase YtcJ [Arthrobacter sp. PvP102]|uniref:amidohydrolase n=1 Tax=unclassified Arthrobacter TaxID=235627 RepID=UPI001AEB8717|nr:MULTISPECIES: amidohydrolase family protein [unclassified Arthrobacter]MBP1233349.1 putative amidohydrolase YtcJ [Arthrobacter sp. PvP103]MBP1238484.1 putative amidohydrolase YtcJ [Arthrobacter sp. PvP102]